MANSTNEDNWAARERLRRIEFLLWWRGWVGRGDLVEVFGISPAQASGDLQRYLAINPGAMIYETSRKRYESTEGMVCALHEPVFDEAVSVFLGGGGKTANWQATDSGDSRMAILSLPKRRVEPAIARRILIALLDSRRVRVRYISLKSGTDNWRELSPAALAWDGSRWHVRAWCTRKEAWQDFVIGRMAAAEWPGKAVENLPVDTEWEMMETVKLRLNPALSAEQKESLRLDYGLAGDILELCVRRVMKRYLLANLYIDEESFLDLPRHFVPEK